jgi:hypothetical protein
MFHSTALLPTLKAATLIRSCGDALLGRMRGNSVSRGTRGSMWTPCCTPGNRLHVTNRWGNGHVLFTISCYLAASHKDQAMPTITPANFSPKLLATMRCALDIAVDRIEHAHRTPATKAKMAQRILAMASEGVTDAHTLTSAAVDEGRVPAE